MGRNKKSNSAQWAAGCETDDIFQGLFEGKVHYREKKLSDVPGEEFPQPIVGFTQFPQFHENQNSSVFRKHGNKKKNVRGLCQTGTFSIYILIFCLLFYNLSQQMRHFTYF